MKKYLRDNPVGLLPNTRMRYLTEQQKEAHLRAAIGDGIRSGDAKDFSFARLKAELRSGRVGRKSPKVQKSLGQVGVVDRASPRFDKRGSFEE